MLSYSTPSGYFAFTTGVGQKPTVGEDELQVRLNGECYALALPRQTHTAHVEWVREACRLPETDAVITDVPGLCVAVKTADCIPVLLWDEDRRIVAAVHAGWKGTVQNIVGNTIRAMYADMHQEHEALHAVIGPGISLQSFEVGDEVYERFRQAGFPMERIARRFPCKASAPGCLPDKWHIDLWEANRWLLEQNGVRHIHTDGTDTFTSAAYYSARREGIGTGRNYNGIMIMS